MGSRREIPLTSQDRSLGCIRNNHTEIHRCDSDAIDKKREDAGGTIGEVTRRARRYVQVDVQKPGVRREFLENTSPVLRVVEINNLADLELSGIRRDGVSIHVE